MKQSSTLSLFARALMIAALVSTANAASFKEAEFTRVINDVRVLPQQQDPQPAKIGSKITGQAAVSTGVASRAELRFPDKTLTRIGSNSVFRLDRGDRSVNLEQGVILLQVPKQIGGAKVRTAAVTAAVTGTSVMFEYRPDGFIKIIVLEGEVDVFMNDRPSVMITLRPGDMLIMKPDATEFPVPVQVDLDELRKTSKLLDPDEFGPPINQVHLNNAQTDQDKLKQDGELLKTAFQIPGRGTTVTLTNEVRQQIFQNLVLQARAAVTPPDVGSSTGGGGGAPGSGSTTPPPGGQSQTGNPNTNTGDQPSPTAPTTPTTPVNTAIRNPGTIVFGPGSSIVTNPHATAYSELSNAIVTMQGTIYRPNLDGNFRTYLYGQTGGPTPVDAFLASHGNWFAFLADEIYISGDIGVNSSVGPRNIALAAQGDVVFGDASRDFPVSSGSKWQLPPSVDALVISTGGGSIYVQEEFSLSGTAEQAQHVFFDASGPGSDILISGFGAYAIDPAISFPDGSFQAVAGRDLTVNGATVEAGEVRMDAGRDITLTEAKIKARAFIQMKAIENLTISNSSQLVGLSLLDTPSMFLTAVNGDVSILQSTVDAFALDALSENGNVTIANSTISADVIKARVLSTGGQLLVSDSFLGRGSPSASSLIKLYGEGANGVRFTGFTTLNANTVDIAGTSVTIDGGSTVYLLNPAGTRVFTDTANFNDLTHGNFVDAYGTPTPVSTSNYGSRPPY